MQITPRSRAELRFENLSFLVLFLAAVGLLAWLSTQYTYRADWTYGQRNSLSPASVKLLSTLTQPLEFTAYVRSGSPFREPLTRFIANYRAAKKDVSLAFVDTDLDPEKARAANISSDGEVVLSYAGRSETLTPADLNEAQVGDAIQRLARSSERYVVYLTGDGERDLNGQHNFDLGSFGKQLTAKGFKLEPLSLAANPSIPENTAVLVIAGPQATVLPGMVRIVRDYVKKGGNLLWLGDPGSLYGLDGLASDLGLHFDGGTILDPESQVLGISDARILLVGQYDPDSAITEGLSTITYFPAATSLSTQPGSGWQTQDFLRTLPRSFLPSAGKQLNGPFAIGVSLTRKTGPDREQRVVVTGDGDFLSNSYVANGGNLDLGLGMLNWLAHDDSLIDINPRPAPDLTLVLSPLAQGVIGFGFLVTLPLVLIILGVVLWLRRRRR